MFISLGHLYQVQFLNRVFNHPIYKLSRGIFVVRKISNQRVMVKNLKDWVYTILLLKVRCLSTFPKLVEC